MVFRIGARSGNAGGIGGPDRIANRSWLTLFAGARGKQKNVHRNRNSCQYTDMKCPKCFNPLRRVASTEDSVWFTCPLGHRFHSETGSGISDSEGHRYAVSE